MSITIDERIELERLIIYFGQLSSEMDYTGIHELLKNDPQATRMLMLNEKVPMGEHCRAMRLWFA